jgi:hypothetical protein
MSLSEHVSITITADSLGVPKAGFGIPMILSVNATFPERIRFYTDLAGVAEDFAVTTSPEYLAASALFSQNPHPEQIAIGKALGKPTQRYSVSISTVENAHTYKLTVKGQGVTATDVTYTSDGSATDGEIVAGLVAALNLVTGKNYTAAGATSPFTITGDATGNWFSVESTEVAYIKIEQNHAEPATTLATDLTAIANENDTWYALYTLYNSEAYVKAAAAHIESKKKMYFADLSMSETVTLASAGTGTSDPADDLATLEYKRTATIYAPSPASMLGAAWMGTRLPYDPGSETWKFAAPSGQTPPAYTSTHKTNLRAKNVNFLERLGGENRMLGDGKVCSGQYVDVTRGLDWLENDIQTSVYNAIAAAIKVPYTDAGIALIESEIYGSLGRGVQQGLLASSPAPSVIVPKASAVDSASKAARLLPDVKFSATLAGAIHKVVINGVVSV